MEAKPIAPASTAWRTTCRHPTKASPVNNTDSAADRPPNEYTQTRTQNPGARLCLGLRAGGGTGGAARLHLPHGLQVLRGGLLLVVRPALACAPKTRRVCDREPEVIRAILSGRSPYLLAWAVAKLGHP